MELDKILNIIATSLLEDDMSKLTSKAELVAFMRAALSRARERIVTKKRA